MHILARAALGMFLLALPLIASAQGRPAGVTTEFVTTSTMSETVSVFGEVVAGRQSAVAARVAGLAQTVPIRVGDHVEQGDVLARLDTELLEIELSQAEAQIAIAEAGIAVSQARLDRAEKAFRRAETLRENSTIAEAQLEERASDFAEARGAFEEAQARIKASETALSEVRYRLENAVIRAPFEAIILDVATEVGQFISAGSQVATLIDTAALEIEASVPARFVNALRADQTVTATTDVGETVELSMRAILPTEFSATRTRPVRFELIEPNAAIAVGQTVTLDVPISAPREVTTVPKDALVQAQGGWSVFLNQDGKATPRTIEIGAALDNAFEVISGLAPGDEVVVRGNERLRPGQDIEPSGPPRSEAPQNGDTQTETNGAEASDENG
ncbi:efflux RND transporter periplasmic adaptor subunit [Marivita hallyeonensis]|uniref:RND family efflux transporter, MFP subunit n=1 Tax=Marivita hallyeonensis TaxID=996342 RepID=A0A1M5UP15_9RHOB|nr:efflux RND transporter periplasmic adaptor subunit [Marivita hallyeonensis]SHH64646.1 RND family efflux transporter, MFP subunit [Marivita hallyeonensis]